MQQFCGLKRVSIARLLGLSMKMASLHVAPKSRPSARPIQLFFDFDGTITKSDTMSTLAQAGYQRQKQVEQPPRLRPWKDIVNAYLDDFKAHQDKYRPKSEYRRSIVDEIKWLKSFEDIEAASAERANDEHIFDNLTTEDLDQCAENAVKDGTIRFRPGLNNLISAVVAHNQRLQGSNSTGCINIISVNWSRCFVGSTVFRAAQSRGTINTSGMLDVYANELPSILHGKHSSEKYGGASLDIRTSGRKVQLMEKLVAERAQYEVDGLTPITLYFGDSLTDLECLLAADYGICVRDEPLTSGQKELKETCERVEISVHDFTKLAPNSDSQLQPQSLYYVKDFDGVCQWLKAYMRS